MAQAWHWEHDTFAWTHRLDIDELLAMVASRSYVIVRSEPERAALLAQVRELTTSHPDLAGQETFALPYITHVFRAERS